MISNKALPQKGDAVVAGAAAAGLLGATIFSAAAAYDAFVEKLENEATEWVLTNHPEYTRFELKLMNVRNEKLTNMSDITSCTFIVKPENDEKFVMMWIVSYGWWNDYGVDFAKIVVRTFNSEEWKDVLWAYFQCGTEYMPSSRDSIPIYSKHD
ncbi:MAG: hypothetical protein ACKOW8_14310, partial [Flavobacteriales bacterium]